MGIADFGGKPQIEQGTIVMWAGLLADIPSGWVLCDGNNGSPNLFGKYLRSVADANTDPGSSGGNNNKTLSESNLPSHGHGGSSYSDGNHNHIGPYEKGGADMNYESERRYYAGNYYKEYDTETTGSHSHSLTVNNTGGGNAYDNRPQSVQLAHIMKL